MENLIAVLGTVSLAFVLIYVSEKVSEYVTKKNEKKK
jgi:hypothetical protein